MIDIRQVIYKLKEEKIRIKQAGLLYSVSFINLPILIITNIVITKFLGVNEFGNYKFILNLFNVFAIIFTFGFPMATNRSLVLIDEEKNARKLYGASILVQVLLIVLMSAGIFIYASLDNNISGKGLFSSVIFFIPLSWMIFLNRNFEPILQGDNKIKLLALLRFIPKILFLALLVLMVYLFNIGQVYRLNFVLTSSLISILIGISLILYKVKPIFLNFKENVNKLLELNKEFGFPIYVGSIFAVAMGELTGVIISYFSINNDGVGFLGIARAITVPLTLIPNIISTTYYKDFAKMPKIPLKLTTFTFVITFFSLFLLLILIKPFIQTFYDVTYYPVVKLTVFFSIGVVLVGLGDFFNRFIGANGEGKILRNVSIISGSILLILNIVFIKNFGYIGSAFSKIISGIVYLGLMYFYYKKVANKKIKRN